MSSRLAAATHSPAPGGVVPGGVSLRGLPARSATGSPDLLRRSRLLAVWRLTPIWRAASATPRPGSVRETGASRPLGESFALRMLGHGRAPLTQAQAAYSMREPSPFVTLGT